MMSDGTRKKLTLQQRNQIADKLMTWANMVFAAMVVTQLFSAKFSTSVALAGVFLFADACFLADYLMKGGDQG